MTIAPPPAVLRCGTANLQTLGIPGNLSTAMVLVALMIHGIRPGPMLMSEHPELFWGTVASMYVGRTP